MIVKGATGSPIFQAEGNVKQGAVQLIEWYYKAFLFQFLSIFYNCSIFIFIFQ